MSRPSAGRGKRHVWDDPQNVRRLIVFVFAACAVVALLDLAVHRHSPFEHGELALEGTWFFYAWYGFVSCVGLVLAAKLLRRLVMREPEYYRPPGEEPEAAERSPEGDP
ncbi:MAG TPA: hypothetical protein VMT85_14530 [Thermoanaerobaculia bacterium]|nr:hypothetical protein [Thermoanaerobaculia bacterium]